jgi:hypothetical protein
VQTPIFIDLTASIQFPQPVVSLSSEQMDTLSTVLISEPLPSTSAILDDHHDTSVEPAANERLPIQEDQHEDVILSDNDSGPISFIPPRNIPSWALISASVVPEAPPRSPYSIRELALFMFLLNTPSEQAKFSGSRKTIDWAKFSKRWKYWCQVERALGRHDYMFRTPKQLKQKKKDDASTST